MKDKVVTLLLVTLLACLLYPSFSNNLKTVTGDTSSVNTDSWPMFQKDLAHSGYSTTWGPQTNNVLWTTSVGEIESSPAIVNGVVYVGSYSGFVYALNASSGAIIWSYAANENTESSPTVVDNVVYIGAGNYSATRDNGHVYALQATTGEKLWSYQTGGTVESSPAVAYGKVYVGCGDGNVYAFDAATGNVIWSYKTDATILKSSPAVVEGVVYICSIEYLYALNATNGMKLWSQTGDWRILSSSPMVTNNIVYLSADGVYAFDSKTGELLWHQISDRYPNSSESTPALADGVIYVGTTEGNVLALNASDGSKLWAFPTESTVAASPAVVRGVVYVISCNGTFYALNAYNGTNLWSYSISDIQSGVLSSVAVVDGIAYVGSNSGLYAFGDLSYTPPEQSTNSTWTLPVTTQNGTTINLTMSGNITIEQMSNVTISMDIPSLTANISFALTGENGTTGFSNITLPRNEIPGGTTPLVYIDNSPADNQGFTQDNNNYYVWYTTHFSTHQISILFASPTSPTGDNQSTTQPSWVQIIYGVAVGVAIAAVIIIALALLMRDKTKVQK